MHTKYSNIFWHEGVKIFGERMIGSEQGQVRIRHLENDVTKALLNVFEHGSKVLLRTFLRLLRVEDAPDSFSYDFQVTDSESYRRRGRRIMLSIIADSTQRISSSTYSAQMSRPDGCIYNDHTAIETEAATLLALPDAAAIRGEEDLTETDCGDAGANSEEYESEQS